jgi:hypothetical protein
LKKLLVVCVIVLFLGVAIAPSTGSRMSNDDTTPPEIDVTWEIFKDGCTWYVNFICDAYDEESGIDRIEMFVNDGIHETIVGTMPIYEFIIEWSKAFKTSVFRFVAYNRAGLSTFITINGSDIKSYYCSQSSSTQQSSSILNNQNTMSVILSTEIRIFSDDTTPPVTTYTLDPPEPDGENGWYVRDVEVTLNATDDMSGVKEIKYKIGSWSWQTISGDNGTFIIDIDGNDLWIQYYAIDNAGNEESHNSFTIDMDQTVPDAEDIWWETYEIDGKWFLVISIDCTDATSGMNRVEFYMNEELQERINGSGPNYEWELELDYNYSVIGLICKRNITVENLSFYAICLRYNEFLSAPPLEELYTIETISYDNAGNFVISGFYIPSSPPFPEPSIWFTHFTFTNNYEGYIGRFFIWAHFENKPLENTSGW